jgi:TRAP-type C4-dicarboxylate transport system permease small subunit
MNTAATKMMMSHFLVSVVVGLILILIFEMVQIGEAMNAKHSAAASHQKHHAGNICKTTLRPGGRIKSNARAR